MFSATKGKVNNEPNHIKLPDKVISKILELLNAQNRKFKLSKAQLLDDLLRTQEVNLG